VAPHDVRPAGVWTTYLLATMLAGVGLVFSLNAPWHAPEKTFVLLLIAVVLSAYLGGFGPGFWAALIGALGSVYFLLPPIHSLHVETRSNLLLVGGFMTLATVLAFVIERSLSRESSG
jgi:two-component system, sensor histidine kinase and response regulator